MRIFWQKYSHFEKIGDIFCLFLMIFSWFLSVHEQLKHSWSSWGTKGHFALTLYISYCPQKVCLNEYFLQKLSKYVKRNDVTGFMWIKLCINKMTSWNLVSYTAVRPRILFYSLQPIEALNTCWVKCYFFCSNIFVLIL